VFGSAFVSLSLQLVVLVCVFIINVWAVMVSRACL